MISKTAGSLIELCDFDYLCTCISIKLEHVEQGCFVCSRLSSVSPGNARYIEESHLRLWRAIEKGK